MCRPPTWPGGGNSFLRVPVFALLAGGKKFYLRSITWFYFWLWLGLGHRVPRGFLLESSAFTGLKIALKLSSFLPASSLEAGWSAGLCAVFSVSL